ncbi:MAG TPA: tetratricopeptide repeat protein, partial [Azonexus sp.]|nr:tetratricopeptide repeat protein [Azonexus sp.]
RLSHLYLQLGHNEKALALSAELIKRLPQNLEALDLRAYTLRQSGYLGEALLVYQEIQRLFPENREAPKAIGMILIDLGSPRLSAYSMEQQGLRLDTNESLRLANDQGAQHLRWAPGDPNTQAERFRNADLAIVTLVTARDQAISLKAAPETLLRIRRDLVIAYHARNRWLEAIAEYELLVDGGSTVPDYVTLTAASSYASAGRYPEAEALLRQLAEQTPDSFESGTAWVYALSDVERFDEGQKVSSELVTSLARTDLNNAAKASAYTSARLTQAMLFAYRGRYPEAEQSLDKLQADAPGSLDATEAAGIVAAWRGHPRKAEEQFQIVLGEQPERLESRMALANAQLDRGDAAPLRQALDELGPIYPDQRSIREAQRRQELHDGNYVVANAVFGDDQEAVAGNRTREFDIKAYGKPFGEGRWRAFGRYRDLWSGPVVDTTASNLSSGLKYSITDWTTEIEAGADGYARLETAHSMSDQWSTGISIEKNMLFRPARAVEAGVKADTVSLGLRWRQDENFDIAGGYRFTNFSNNQRSEIYLATTKSLYTDFDRRLSAGARISGQRNSDPDVAYFSPERQVEASGTLNFEFRQWQDMATKKSSLWHRVWLTAGEVNQAGFGTHSMSNIGYGQEVALSDAVRIRWSIARTRYPFDGVSAAYYTGNIGFEGYF